MSDQEIISTKSQMPLAQLHSIFVCISTNASRHPQENDDQQHLINSPDNDFVSNIVIGGNHLSAKENFSETVCISKQENCPTDVTSWTTRYSNAFENCSFICAKSGEVGSLEEANSQKIKILSSTQDGIINYELDDMVLKFTKESSNIQKQIYFSEGEYSLTKKFMDTKYCLTEVENGEHEENDMSTSSITCSSNSSANSDSDDRNVSDELSRSSSSEISLSAGSENSEDWTKDPSVSFPVAVNEDSSFQNFNAKNLDDSLLTFSDVKESEKQSPDSKVKSSASDSFLVQQRSQIISELNNQFSSGKLRISKSQSRLEKQVNDSTDLNEEVPKSFKDLFTPPSKLPDTSSLCRSKSTIDLPTCNVPEKKDISCDVSANEKKELVDSATLDDPNNTAIQCFVAFLIFLVILVMSDPWSCNLLALALCYFLCE